MTRATRTRGTIATIRMRLGRCGAADAWLKLYENSLLIAFGVLFIGSLIGHAVGGAHEYSSEHSSTARPG